MAVDELTILVDIHERRSVVPERLRALGVAVRMQPLEIGDYRASSGAVVERKTVLDLHRSVVSGRFWRQVGDLAREPRAYLLVEGSSIDAGGLSREAVRGALLTVADNGVAILRTSGPADSAVWLRLLAMRAPSGPAFLGRRRRRRPSPTPLALLSSIPGISPQSANSLLERFGSLAQIALAEPAELEAVHGIGPMRAATIRRVLGTSPTGEVPGARAAFESSSPEVPASPARAGRSRGT